MTSDYKGLKTKVNALQANGTTNIMEGVAWGNPRAVARPAVLRRAARQSRTCRRSWSC